MPYELTATYVSVIEVDDRVRCAVQHHNYGHYHNEQVHDLLSLGLCHSTIVEQGWQKECDWCARQGSRNRQEPVKLVVDQQGYHTRGRHNQGATHVLRHLSLAGLWPSPEQPVFNHNVGWVDDERIGEYEVKTEQNLHNVRHPTLLGQGSSNEGITQSRLTKGKHCVQSEADVQ